MIPVYQTMTVSNDGCGNCFNACVASILELPLREVCDTLPRDTPYWSAWRNWLATIGLDLANYPADDPPKGWSIARGPGFRIYPEGHELSGQPISHATVAFNGEVLHDPFPGGTGLKEVNGYWALEPMKTGDDPC